MTTHERTTRLRIPRHMAQRAAKLRREMTHPERALWQILRCKNLGGLKFRRQAVIGNYVVDFFCPTIGLVVEIDGESHVGCAKEDAQRTAFLESKGYQVVRVTNDDVLRDLDAVGLMILQHAGASPTPQPPPSKGGGAEACKARPTALATSSVNTDCGASPTPQPPPSEGGGVAAEARRAAREEIR